MDTSSNSNLRPIIWEQKLFDDVIDGLYFTVNGLMGKEENNIIQIKSDLEKKQGETVRFGLTTKLDGDGVEGDDELEGNEEEIESFSEEVSINQNRFAVRLKGKLDEQKNAYDMRTDAKNKLRIQLQEFIEMQFFLKMGGVTNTTLVDVNGVAYSRKATWSNTPDVIPSADENAGTGARYICANTGGTTALSSTNKLTPALITKARIRAKLASPKLVPLRINGRNHYIMFVHPWQAADLRSDPTYSAAQREAEVRGKENPIFTGALGVWDGVILMEHEYVPFLDISVAGNSFAGPATGTDCAFDCFRALLCGAQALGFAKANNPNGWVEETKDFKNKVAFATGLIGGIQKLVFNSKEFGVIAVDTAATPQ